MVLQRRSDTPISPTDRIGLTSVASSDREFISGGAALTPKGPVSTQQLGPGA